MVISLYICEIPKNVDKVDLEELFKSLEGYLETRIKPTNDMRKIAFVDFKEEKQAAFALETLQGFKFSPEDKGLIVKISDNSKGGMNQPNQPRHNERRMLSHKKGRDNNRDNSRGNSRGNSRDNNRENNRNNRDNITDRSSERKRSGNGNGTSNSNRRYNREDFNYSPSSRSDRKHSPSRSNDSNSDEDYNKDNRKRGESDFKSNPQPQGQVTSGQANANLIDLISLLSSAQNTQGGGINNPNINPNINPIMNPNVNTNLNKPYTLGESNTPAEANSLSGLLEALQGLQTVQLFSSLTGGSNPNQNQNPQPPQSQQAITQSNLPTSSSSSFYNNFSKFDDYFKSSFDFRKNATNIVYVEGLPNDATEREVAHIFRPFNGFKSVRLITREKNNQKSLICFADFEDINQSTVCINTLQGYRFDKNDLVGLHFSYGVSKHKDNRK